MLFRRLISSWILIALLLSACTPTGAAYIAGALPLGPTATKQPLTVFAAASLTEAFSELGARFEAETPDVKVIINFAGSQQLASQLVQGAPADVFASANHRQMEVAVRAGRVSAREVHTFASNRIVVVMPDDNPARLRTLSDLAAPGLKLDLAAEAVPVGAYSLEFLDLASTELAFGPGYKQAVLDNVVSYEQTVKAVLSKVILGEVDAGIVYTSDVSGLNGTKVDQLPIPAALNPRVSYTLAPVGDSSQPELARAFVAFALSPPGQGILAKHGLLPVLAYR